MIESPLPHELRGRPGGGRAPLYFDKQVTFGAYSYQYIAGFGELAWDRLSQALEELEADCFVVVSESSLPKALLDEVSHRVGLIRPTTTLTFSGGERAKTAATLDRLAAGALEQGASRRSCVLGVGGGLAGNVAGLLAALLFRGIRFVQIPTTLLGMSDSVLSLKQAVNSSVGKNHIGTFHKPEFVWSNIDFLAGLPVIERKAAMCEVIKNVLAIRPGDYDEVAGLVTRAADFSVEEHLRIIELAIEQKSAVMADDPYEKREALVLEYGHTVGHALEVGMRGLMPHGIAVGVGMIVAAKIACRLELADDLVEQTHHDLLGRLDVPTAIPATIDPEALMARIRRDNKRGYLEPLADAHDMVLLQALGHPLSTGRVPLTRVPDTVIEDCIRACQARQMVHIGLARARPATEEVRVAGSAEMSTASV
jgi:3-dehydroquinate synthetase